MSKKILSTSIIQAVANNIRRLRNITSEIQPINFDEELKKIFSLDNHFMHRQSEIYLETVQTPQYAFAEDNTIEKVVFSNLQTISPYSFYGCSNLKEVILPDKFGKTGFEKKDRIGQYAFHGCAGLEKIDLRYAIGLASKAFTDCTNLQTIILRKTDDVCNLNAASVFSNTPIASGNGYIYVPIALLEKYKNATNWTTYADKIKPIEGSEFE